MDALIGGLDQLTTVLRMALFGVGVVVAALAALSYAVRTRRISPFSPVSRLVRGSVDPLFAPVERRVLSAGGRPATAPWWALAAVVIGGIVLISVLGFVRGQIALVLMATSTGARGLVSLAIAWTFGVLRLALLVRVASSWFPSIRYSRPVLLSYTLTEWLVRPLRQIIPPFGMIDVSPIAAYFALALLEMGVRALLG